MDIKPFKILFVKPHAQGKGPQVTDVPLAFMYLSAFLKANLSNIEIQLIDLRLEKNPGSALADSLKMFAPHLVGISLLTLDREFPDNWLKTIRHNAPVAKIVIGGPLATYEYHEILKNNAEIHCAVLGEGENAFLDLVRAYMQGRDRSKVTGIAYLHQGEVVTNGSSQLIENLDELPMPDYALLDLDRYMNPLHLTFNIILAEKRYIHVMSSRGCPYGCLFCHNIFGKKIRKESPEKFVSQLRFLYEKYDVREFHLVDDNFNYDRQRMHEILRLIINSSMNIKIAFPNGLRFDLLTREDILLLKEAGTYEITVAIDTASQRLQKVIHKNMNIEKALQNIEFAKTTGMFTRGYFMIGFPGETVDEIKETIRCALKSPLDMASFLTVVPFKGTGLWRLAKEIYPGLADHDKSFFYQKKPFYQEATGYNLKRTQIVAYLRFYLPFRIFRTYANMPRKTYGIMRWIYWGPQFLLPHLFRKKSVQGKGDK